MTTPRFAIAKFIPDLRRMEPRNFGVVVWNRGTCVGRFLGDSPEDERHFARLELAAKETYLQWIEYWRLKMNKPVLTMRSGQEVKRGEPGYLDALCATSLENFVLADAGHLADTLAESKSSSLAQALFESVVLEPESDRDRLHEHSEVLKREALMAITSSGLSQVDGFCKKYDFLCDVGDTKQPFRFHFGIHKKAPLAVLHRVNLHSPTSVHDAAFMFQSMSQKSVRRELCGAIVHANEDELSNDNAFYNSFKLMSSVGTVINVAHQSDAVALLANVASRTTSSS